MKAVPKLQTHVFHYYSREKHGKVQYCDLKKQSIKYILGVTVNICMCVGKDRKMICTNEHGWQSGVDWL